MKIAILSSSRADYGIYRNLLKLMSKDERFDLTIIVFGMHLQSKYGKTINMIKEDNFGVIDTVDGMPINDSIKDISSGYGQLIINFSNYWNENKFDCVFALGDRFEMSAAVQSGIPFEINFAHIHGGETTTGSLDNIYRHQISLASKIHFTSTSTFSKRVSKIVGTSKNIYDVGSLSLENLNLNKLPSWNKVCKIFNIPNVPFILVTFHPETVAIQQNINFIKVIENSLKTISNKIHVLITQTNADAAGNLYREMIINLKKQNSTSISIVENFGKDNYFSAMRNSNFLLGNTSSGIIEAASFNKYVVNVGNRQKGRFKSGNVVDVLFNEKKIVETAFDLLTKDDFNGSNVYKKENTSVEIINIIQKFINND